MAPLYPLGALYDIFKPVNFAYCDSSGVIMHKWIMVWLDTRNDVDRAIIPDHIFQVNNFMVFVFKMCFKLRYYVIWPSTIFEPFIVYHFNYMEILALSPRFTKLSINVSFSLAKEPRPQLSIISYLSHIVELIVFTKTNTFGSISTFIPKALSFFFLNTY